MSSPIERLPSSYQFPVFSRIAAFLSSPPSIHPLPALSSTLHSTLHTLTHTLHERAFNAHQERLLSHAYATNGYRDGLEQGKLSVLQSAFDTALIDGIRTGFHTGHTKGLLAATALFTVTQGNYWTDSEKRENSGIECIHSDIVRTSNIVNKRIVVINSANSTSHTPTTRSIHTASNAASTAAKTAISAVNANNRHITLAMEQMNSANSTATNTANASSENTSANASSAVDTTAAGVESLVRATLSSLHVSDTVVNALHTVTPSGLSASQSPPHVSPYSVHDFRYKSNILHCEAIKLTDLAEKYNTPLYVYSQNTIKNNYWRLYNSMAKYINNYQGNGKKIHICYAMKANSSLGVLNLFKSFGAGFDLVSGGELQRIITLCDHKNNNSNSNSKCTENNRSALSASVFAGVGKREEEIVLALNNNIYSFHVESLDELNRINAIAAKLNKTAPIAIRINPNVDAHTHSKITTGKSENKFGIPLSTAESVYTYAKTLGNIEIRGIQMHIGSQLTEIQPFMESIIKITPLIEIIQSKIAPETFKYFSIGGGIGVEYTECLESGNETWWSEKLENNKTIPLTPEHYAACVGPLLNKLNLDIFMEPGRNMVANGGVLISRVEHIKKGENKSFLIIDAAMNDLIRPAMYEAFHQIIPVNIENINDNNNNNNNNNNSDNNNNDLVSDIVGPVCETGDCFATDRRIPHGALLTEGSYVSIMSAGAYGYTMASNYNTRGKPCCVLVNGDIETCIVKRETFQQQIQNEIIPTV